MLRHITPMKLLLAFTPFHTPTSPPFGLACLKASLAKARPDVDIKVIDWNVAFFRRWLLGDPPHLCDHHPDSLLGQVCPNLLVFDGQGRDIWQGVKHVPVNEEEANRYMTFAKRLDDVFKTLATFYYGLLVPYVEGRFEPPASVIDRIFAAELAKIDEERPDVLGFSILAEQNLLYALALGRAAKERFNLPIALGGAMMSHLDASEVLNAFPWVDYVFWGEGEKTIVDFVNALDPSSGGELESVFGVGHRTEDGRACLHPHPAPPGIEELPFPDFSDYTLTDYLVAEPVLPIITCRGCYWGRCAFCSHMRPYGPGVRVRPPAQVVDEMEYQMKRHTIRRFLFVDEAIAPSTLRDLTEEIINRQLDIRWGAEGIRVERQFDMELLSLAHRAGLRWVYVGIESATQRLLNLMEKGTDLATIHEFIETCRKVGITLQLSYIIGIPGISHEELLQEMDFLSRYPVDASPYVLLLGSTVQQRPKEFGIRIEDQQVLYRTRRGIVHAPRFYFTSANDLSPELASEMIEQMGVSSRRRMRPHLGEIHALLLADTDFFATEARPPTPDRAPQRAFAYLEQQSHRDQRWSLHAAGCLEALGDLQGALEIVRCALSENDLPSALRRRLTAHLAALCNHADRPDLVLSFLEQSDLTQPPGQASRGQLVRAHAVLNHHDGVITHAEAMLETGYETREIYCTLGYSYEQMGRAAEALEAYRAAELRDWYDPEINRAQARCLRALNQRREAREMELKARRKEAHLGIGRVFHR